MTASRPCCVGVSLQCSEVIAKISNCAFKCDHYYYYCYLLNPLVRFGELAAEVLVLLTYKCL